jgi:hypothetical protein
VETVPDDDWQECAETIKDGDNGNLYTAMQPALDIFSGFLDIGPSVVTGSG